MRVFEQVADDLRELGVTTVFGLIGSGNYDFTRALIERGAKFVAARHEGGAVSMADGFSRVGQSVPAVSVHQGCGLTNLVTGLTEAVKSSTPMIVLTAEVAASASHSNFWIQQDRLVESVGAVSFRLTPESASREIERAYTTAVTKRIPVVVNLPLDVQQATLTDTHTVRTPQLVPTAPNHAAVVALGDLIAAAERPVIIAGRGARHAGPELRALGARSGALLATSAVSRGLFNVDEFSLDVSGGLSTPLAAELIPGADLIVSFGSALNMWTTGHGRLLGEAKRVQVDVDPLAPGRHRSVDFAVIGDSVEVARAVTAELAQRGLDREGYRTPEIRERIAVEGHWPSIPFEDSSDAEHIDPRALTIELNRMLDRERVTAIDSGNFLGWPSVFLDTPDANGLVFGQGFQCVGLGLATAIGASFAQPERLAICGTGDVGLLMAAAELETVVRLGIPLVIIAYNDAAAGAELHHFGASDIDLGFITFPDTDFRAIAAGYGFTAVTVRSVKDLDPVQTWLDGPRDTPLLIDAKITRIESWWLTEAFKGH
ncbi:MAG: thiamine pyrophosphate-binding protein [Gulosibacter sp.]|uniref:thiamine pyrophosphate-binding protein n=1 Tax=Gulosibacter sp. TaxID=2817531 RepID=UPI003F90D346